MRNNMPRKKKNNKAMNVSIPADLFEFIEDYRWENRFERSKIATIALEEWAFARGFEPGE